MIKIENTDVLGWEAAVRGMRNPMNSWDKSDSTWYWDGDDYDYNVGENDLELMMKLSAAGTDHGKFLRMINVQMDITAPLYWWKEFDKYQVAVVTNSTSTMHKIHARELTLDDFSGERLDPYAGELLRMVLRNLNTNRLLYIETGNRQYWDNMIQLLPSSYNQRRTVQLNYAVLKNMYFARRNHKLDEWHSLCAWIETLPYSELITGERSAENGK